MCMFFRFLKQNVVGQLIATGDFRNVNATSWVKIKVSFINKCLRNLYKSQFLKGQCPINHFQMSPQTNHCVITIFKRNQTFFVKIL